MPTYRDVAALNLPGPVPLVIERMDEMILGATNTPLLANSNPTVAAMTADNNTLRAKQAARGTGPAAINARDDALKQVKKNAENFRIFTQQVADANPSQAATIITSAAMFVKKVVVRQKPDFAVVEGLTSGTATANVKSRGRGATYFWSFSSDGKVWVALALPTRKATATFTNLTPGTLYYFRFQVLTKTGMSDWSQVLSLIAK
jgi:hypothetical protein